MNLGLSSITKKLHYGSQLRPARDWLVLLIVFAIGLGLSVAYNLYIFSKVTQGQQVGNAPVEAPAQIQLDQVKTLFDDRAAQRGRYDSQYRFIDPSR